MWVTLTQHTLVFCLLRGANVGSQHNCPFQPQHVKVTRIPSLISNNCRLGPFDCES